MKINSESFNWFACGCNLGLALNAAHKKDMASFAVLLMLAIGSYCFAAKKP